MKIAVQGCSHGELDKIYAHISNIERKQNIKIELLLCCGDFQANRDENDLKSMATPKKYHLMKDFKDYYIQKKVAPILTIVIGGNHEATNHMWELPYGGWLAENIYYLVYSGVIQYRGVRIAGLSGIYNSKDFRKGHFERPPFNEDTKRSMYHVKYIDIARLKKLDSKIDIMMSHDWPSNIQLHGDVEEIYKQKPYLRKEPLEHFLKMNDGAEELLHGIQPTYWFAAHHHCKFGALVKHEDEKNTKFLALGKYGPEDNFLHVIDFNENGSQSEKAEFKNSLEYDFEWLNILKATDHLVKMNCQNRHNDYSEKTFLDFCYSKNDKEKYMRELEQFTDDMSVLSLNQDSESKARDQTRAFCSKFQLTDPCEVYCISSKIQKTQFR